MPPKHPRDNPISISTANLYFLPFSQTLEIIAQAGFEHIELDLYWARGKWAIAQHLKGLQARKVVRMIDNAGLKVSSIHDASGVVNNVDSADGFIDPQLKEYLNQLGYAPDCIVFHTPHMEGPNNPTWWDNAADAIGRAAASYASPETLVTIENMPLSDGYYVPMTTPDELMTFVSKYGLGITFDTTHYAQIGVDVVQAARVLKGRIKTLHISDYADGKTHLFIGAGTIDFEGLFRVLDLSTLRSITLECSVGLPEENVLEITRAAMVDRLKTAKSRLQNWLAAT